MKSLERKALSVLLTGGEECSEEELTMLRNNPEFLRAYKEFRAKVVDILKTSRFFLDNPSCSRRRAARELGIPESTLRNRLMKQRAV